MIWGIYVINKTSFSLKNYIILTAGLSLCSFFIRKLPVYWGIHTLIAIILIISIMFIQGIPLIASTYGTLSMFLILSFSEFLNILILSIFNIEINLVYVDSIMGSIRKCLLGIPSLIIMFLFITLIDYFKNRRN